MASSTLLVLLSSLLLLISPSHTALVLPVMKDTQTLQYLTLIGQRSPLVTVNLVVDLGGKFLWVDCESNYSSNSYSPAYCGSAPCLMANATLCSNCSSALSPGCNNNTCTLLPSNPISHGVTNGELATDTISLSLQSPLLGYATLYPFLFLCAPTYLLENLATGVQGMAGIGRAPIGIPSQLAATFSFPRKFALCLPTSGTKGVMFFANGPNTTFTNVHVSEKLIHTPLLTNPVSTSPYYDPGEPSFEYFIGVTSIKIDGKRRVSLNTSLLSINEDGFGGTKISTLVPYTTMETSIYEAVIEAITMEMDSIGFPMAPVPPFGACFNFTWSGLGPDLFIDLVLQSESVYWRIAYSNAIVWFAGDVGCLGFLDGGVKPRTSIVIGGYQLENNFLQFDLDASKLGICSSVDLSPATCSSF